MKLEKSILLIEDNRVDALAIQRALRHLHVTNPLIVARHGEEALSLLHDSPQHPPCIILLDLNMPTMGGDTSETGCEPESDPSGGFDDLQ